jgi:hypothetical protein
MTTIPDVIFRYYEAAAAGDLDTLIVDLNQHFTLSDELVADLSI